MISKLKKIKLYKLYRFSHLNRVITDKFNLVNEIPSKERSLENVFTWIKQSFLVNSDGGSSAYYRMGKGWKGSYPETTGYLIPTLYDYYHYTKHEDWKKFAINASDWLLKIQHQEGGWQGLQVDEKCDLRVFNTAMILDGLIRTYIEENDKKYLEAAIKGFKWTLCKMDAKGFFVENNVSDGGSFDTLVLACLLMVYQHLPKDEQNQYHDKLIFSLDAHLNLIQENGWIKNCNFNTSYKNTALLHHIGYTLDGLIISSEILGDKKYYNAAKKTALKVLSKFEVNVSLPAFFNPDWTAYKDLGTGHSICLTGCSQIAIVFIKIYKTDNDLRFLNGALKLIDIVGAIGNYKSVNNGISYGLPGSYPVFGNYQPYQFVNWAAKYHAESLLLSLNKSKSKKA
jgi:hypothetical protein